MLLLYIYWNTERSYVPSPWAFNVLTWTCFLFQSKNQKLRIALNYSCPKLQCDPISELNVWKHTPKSQPKNIFLTTKSRFKKYKTYPFCCLNFDMIHLIAGFSFLACSKHDDIYWLGINCNNFLNPNLLWPSLNGCWLSWCSKQEISHPTVSVDLHCYCSFCCSHTRWLWWEASKENK